LSAFVHKIKFTEAIKLLLSQQCYKYVCMSSLKGRLTTTRHRETEETEQKYFIHIRLKETGINTEQDIKKPYPDILQPESRH
jgi:hypothetical protein